MPCPANSGNQSESSRSNNDEEEEEEEDGESDVIENCPCDAGHARAAGESHTLACTSE